MIKALLIGDYSESVIAHGAIPKALALAAQNISIDVRHDWLATDPPVRRWWKRLAPLRQILPRF